MTDLITWLRAQLDEDERVAGSATSGPWSNDDPMARDGVFAKAIDDFVVDCDYVHMGPFAVHNATHIALHDPSRVLAEVAAKRQMIEAEQQRAVGDGLPERLIGMHETDVLRLLALPYADRPGYREEWRP